MEVNSQEGRNRTAIDLFCGCGGISVGLELAGLRVIAGVDIESRYMSTFSENFPSAKSLLLDISKVGPRQFMNLVGIRRGELFLLAGGPPCQGFSKNVPRKQRQLDDSRNLLVRTFISYCEALQPQIVLMENVAEMKNGFERAYTDEILERLNSAGYSVSYSVLNAADFGVPQRRRRAFFLATRGSQRLQPPTPTHSEGTDQGNLLGIKPHVTVWEAIGDLPSLHHGEGELRTNYSVPPFSEFQILIRRNSRQILNHIARELQPKQFARLAALRPGQSLKDLPRHLKVEGGYSGAYGRLTEKMVAPTITRWVFHPGSGRWGHPRDTRLITMREAARLQGFPDWFEFVGTYNQQAGQIGNAVPPMLVHRVVSSVLDQAGLSKRVSRVRNLSGDSLSRGVGILKVVA